MAPETAAVVFAASALAVSIFLHAALCGIGPRPTIRRAGIWLEGWKMERNGKRRTGGGSA
jgi:hypothetical protein